MIKSVDKALSILSYMINEGSSTPIPLRSIAAACNLNQATCSHIIDTLCANAFLEKISRKDGYILGPMGFCISAQQYYRQELIEAALPVMRRLSRNLCEDSALSTYSNNKLFVPLTVFYNDDGVSYMKLKKGKLYQSAAGRIFVANMNPRQLDDLIANIGYPQKDAWDVGSDRASMDRALADIRKSGMVAAHKVVDNLSAVSAPVYAEGRLQAAVGVYMECDSFEGEHRSECIRQTVQAAELISRKLKSKLSGAGASIYSAGGV